MPRSSIAVRIRPGGRERGADVSPLIDMVFILLIFFIVTTVFVDEAGFALLVPGPSQGQPPPDRESVRLALDAHGEIRWEGQVLSRDDVRRVVRDHPRASVLVEVHEAALAGWMVQVADAARLGGAEQVSVARARAK